MDFNALLEQIKPLFGIFIFGMIWWFWRRTYKTNRQIQIENQEDTLALLEEIKEELKKLNKFNEDNSNKNYRL